MSKQSYMTGFCKAASAAGVDPQALAQYVMSKRTEKQAQESKPRFQTNGWAPDGRCDDPLGFTSTNAIPRVLTPGNSGAHTENYRTFLDLVDDMGPEGLNDLISRKDDGERLRVAKERRRKVHDLMGIAYPEYKEWLGAHTNAINEVLSKYLPTWNDVKDEYVHGYRDSPLWLDEAALRDYNKAMFDATNTPVKVESPKK